MLGCRNALFTWVLVHDYCWEVGEIYITLIWFLGLPGLTQPVPIIPKSGSVQESEFTWGQCNMCEWWSALLLSEYACCLVANFFVCRFGKDVCKTRKWTTAVWLDGWSCKQSTCQVEDHQYPAGTDPCWSTAYRSYNLQWPCSEFHFCVYHLEKSNYQAIHMVYCYRSIKGSIRWWSETSSRTD